MKLQEMYVEIVGRRDRFRAEVEKTVQESATGGKKAGEAYSRSFGGGLAAIRGQFLMATAAVTGTVYGIKRLYDASQNFIRAAIEEEVAVKLFTVALGEGVAPARAFVDEIVRLTRADTEDVMRQMANVAIVAGQLGVGSQEAERMAEALVKLGYQTSTALGVNAADAIQAYTMGIMGNMRGLRQYGVAIDEAAIKQNAAKMGLVDQKGVVTEAGQALAAFNLILERTGKFQLDLAQNTDSAIAKMRGETAAWGDLWAAAGRQMQGAAGAGAPVAGWMNPEKGPSILGPFGIPLRIYSTLKSRGTVSATALGEQRVAEAQTAYGLYKGAGGIAGVAGLPSEQQQLVMKHWAYIQSLEQATTAIDSEKAAAQKSALAAERLEVARRNAVIAEEKRAKILEKVNEEMPQLVEDQRRIQRQRFKESLEIYGKYLPGGEQRTTAGGYILSPEAYEKFLKRLPRRHGRLVPDETVELIRLLGETTSRTGLRVARESGYTQAEINAVRGLKVQYAGGLAYETIGPRQRFEAFMEARKSVQEILGFERTTGTMPSFMDVAGRGALRRMERLGPEFFGRNWERLAKPELTDEERQLASINDKLGKLLALAEQYGLVAIG